MKEKQEYKTKVKGNKWPQQKYGSGERSYIRGNKTNRKRPKLDAYSEQQIT